MTHIYPKQEISSGSPLDVLDFSMIEGAGNPTKYPSHNGQDSLYHQLLSNTAKVSNKYLENSTEVSLGSFFTTIATTNLLKFNIKF